MPAPEPSLVAASFTAADRAALCDGAREIADSGMVPGSAGNLSARRGEVVLITPRGAQLRAVAPGSLVEVALEDGAVITAPEDGSRPSSEAPLHRAVYATVEAGAIVHTHSHFATVMSTLVDELPAVHYATVAFGGPLRVARYATFGTDELAETVTEALDGRRGALMANHGAIVAGRDVAHAVALAIQLEWLASVAYHALVAGTPRTLSARDLTAVSEQARSLAYAPEGAR